MNKSIKDDKPIKFEFKNVTIDANVFNLSAELTEPFIIRHAEGELVFHLDGRLIIRRVGPNNIGYIQDIVQWRADE